MNLKYQSQIDSLPCERSGFAEQSSKTSFRWFFEDVNDPRNYLPVYAIDEKRKRKDCLGWALSFFTTSDAAKNRLLEICAARPNSHKKLGNSIASGTLEKEDGISCAEDQYLHFDHFEYESCSLHGRFQIDEVILK